MKKRQNGKSRSAGKMQRILLAAVPALAVLAVGILLLAPTFPRLEVAEYRITEEEYLRAMYQARSDVLSDHAAAGISLTDWQEKTALGEPCALIADRALELLAGYYAVSELAVERGYLQDAGYGAMLREMEEVNRQRREALESGTMITGIPTFTVEDYLSYRASSIRLQFCNDPDNPEYQVTPAELQQRYETDKDNLYVQPDELELEYVVVSASPEETQTRKVELEELRKLALEKGSLASAMEENPGLKGYYEEITVDRSSYSVYARSHGDILSCAEGLNSGELSRVFQQEGWLCLVHCRRRVEHSYTPLEEVASIVAQSIRESRYDELIAERAAETVIDTDLQALYRFTAEQLP